MKLLIGIATLLAFAACSNNKDKDDSDENLTGEAIEIKLWRSDLDDSTGRLVMIQDNFILVDTVAPQPVINYLTREYPRVQLVVEGISNDTIFVAIPDATYLTQQMGSSGPTMFFAAAVYNLTELPGIRYVSFNFEEGDHASPDVLSKESFKDQ